VTWLSSLHSIAVDALRLLLFTLRLLPATTDADLAYRVELAEACAAATTDRTERYLCAKIPRFESLYRIDVGRCEKKGAAGELSAWQILPRGEKDISRLCKSLAEDAKVAIERIRESRAACHHLPTEEQLAIFTRGSCDSVEGRRLSRTRWPYAGEVGP
jgi:hypothetical protein